MSDYLQSTTFYPVCRHYGKKDCKRCSDYYRCEAKLIDESKSLDLEFLKDDADYSPLGSNYRDMDECYSYIFDRKKWMAQHLHTLYADGYLQQIPSNIHGDIYWGLLNAKKPSDLQDNISNTCAGIFSNVLKKWKVSPDDSPLLCPLLNLKSGDVKNLSGLELETSIQLLNLKNIEDDNLPDLSTDGVVVHYGQKDVKELLTPNHSFFKDTQGDLLGQSSYTCMDCIDDTHTTLVYPEVDAPKDNPYKLKQKNYASISRLYSRLTNIIDGYNLKNVVLGSFTFTIPRELSDYLFNLGKDGEDMIWSCFKAFKDDLNELIFKRGAISNKRRKKRPYATEGIIGHRANLHIWSSGSPLSPHVHIHDSILNQALTGDDDNPILEPILHYYSKDDLKAIKRLWTSHLLSLANRLGISCPTLTLNDEDIGLTTNDGRSINLADVHYKFNKITNDNKGLLYHALFYQNRDYLVDFAKYSNKNLDCDNPNDLFLAYHNCGRAYGLFRKLKLLEDCMPIREPEKEIDKESDISGDESDIFGDEDVKSSKPNKTCPICGKKMKYRGKIKYISQLPEKMWSCDWDYKENRMVKARMIRDEMAWYANPIMFELGESDPEYIRLHSYDNEWRGQKDSDKWLRLMSQSRAIRDNQRGA